MGKGGKREEKSNSNLKKADICGFLGDFWDFRDFAAKQRVRNGESPDWKTADEAEEDEDMYEEDWKRIDRGSIHSSISRINAI